jgi:hypothetical protein
LAAFKKGKWTDLPAIQRVARCCVIARGATLLAETEYQPPVRKRYTRLAAQWTALAAEVEHEILSPESSEAHGRR